MPMPISRQRAHLIGIFIVAFAVLAYQVLLTRLFSVMLYYHFAFAGVSLVMLGLTIGAERVYLNAQKYSADRLEAEWSKAACRFAVSGVAVVLWFIYAPLLVPARLAFPVLIASLILFAVPLVFSGICVTLILTRSGFPIGRLYAADLIGAAAGCIGIVALLFLLDPISIFLALAALIAVSAWIMAPPRTRPSRQAGWLTAAFCVVCAGQSALYLTGQEHVRVVWAKGHPQAHILFERWNALSRIRVIPYQDGMQGGSMGPFGWGFGHAQTQKIDQLYLDIDADASTVITRFDGTNLKPFAFLGNDVINAGYHVRPVKTAAVVGVGGGRDVMSALYFGVAHVTGIEINPAIFEALTKRFADFTGHFYRRPDVTLVNAEARSWINQNHNRFDLIQISLIDTWAATAAGGLTMSENKLYTVNAWKELMARLTPDGMLQVSRWFDAQSHRSEYYRLLSLAAETLRARGVPDDQIRSHILAFRVNRIVTVVTSVSAFTPAELARAHQAADAEGLTVIADPATALDATALTIASGQANAAFYDALPMDITAPTDNKPFFFYTWKPHSFFADGPRELDGGSRNDLAILVMGFLLVTTSLGVGLFVIAPLRHEARQARLRPMLPHLLYFAGIGLGFMLVEISQMQRLMVFLGDPIYGLTVLLFTLLLFGGLGSFTVGAGGGEVGLWRRPALCCAVLCAVGLLTPVLTAQATEFGVPARVALSVALLAPAGLCMGMMFPTGMILSRRFAAQQAWFWGVNGATSVFASVLGMAVSMEYGIAQAYWAGVVCYVGCMGLVLGLRQGRERLGGEAAPQTPAFLREPPFAS
jgi:hypothetical protein